MKHNKQRNICVSMRGKATKSYNENLDFKGIIDSKKFWATVKLLFPNKINLESTLLQREMVKL